MKLYSYFQSTAAYRVRIALNLKNIPYEIVPVDLFNGQQFSEEYKFLNCQARIPILTDDKITINQSAAILEYLEEQYPQILLLPANFADRAWIRSVAQIIISDIHPLNNLGVLKYLANTLKQDKGAIQTWYHHWLKTGFDALEEKIKSSPRKGQYCYGNTITLADVCLIPQIYNAVRFKFPLNDYPTLVKINEACLALPQFFSARPEAQPDYVKRD